MCLACSNPLHLSRRGFFAGAAALSLTGARPLRAQGAAPNAIAPDEALRRIMEGNARYAANAPANRDLSAGRAARASAQYPIAAILSCADSRVAPELAFDQGPGELFVVRLAGNFVNDDGLASLEYGARFLGIPLVMILGHSGCGAVDATIKVVQDNVVLPGHLPDLVGSIRPAVEAAIRSKPANLLETATVENVRHNMRRVTDADPIMSGLVKEGKVKVVGGVYDIATGRIAMVPPGAI